MMSPRVLNFSRMSSNDIHNRYSFYADPRYHDYHRSTQPNYHPTHNDYNSNSKSHSERSPYLNRDPAYSSLSKRERLPHNYDYAKANGGGLNHTSPAHKRYTSYDSAAAAFKPNGRTNPGELSDYDDPRGADNSIYARIRKPPLSGTVSNPARV